MINRYALAPMRFLLFGLLSYGLLYYAYKFYQPKFGGADYGYYFDLYINPLSAEVQDPFRTRKLSAFFTFLVAKSGFYYPSEICYQQPVASQKIFFAALFSNYLALLATATVCSFITRERGLVAIMAGVIVMLSFGTMNFVITGLTEGVSWLLVALGFYFYSRGQFKALWAVVLVSLFQRETIAILFGIFAVVDWWKLKGTDPEAAKIRMLTMAICALSFGLYLAFRALVPGIGPFSQQLSLPMMWQSVTQFRLTSDWIFRVVLLQNLFFVGALLLFCLRKTGQPTLPYLAHISVCIAVFTVGGLLAGINDSVGRILQILTPILAPLFATALGRLRL